MQKTKERMYCMKERKMYTNRIMKDERYEILGLIIEGKSSGKVSLSTRKRFLAGEPLLKFLEQQFPRLQCPIGSPTFDIRRQWINKKKNNN